MNLWGGKMFSKDINLGSHKYNFIDFIKHGIKTVSMKTLQINGVSFTPIRKFSKGKHVELEK